ncbi:MAG TPA: c-type cytochrome [Methylothermaceae bacterium]|nr:c-type cytochrome [Methylothermaceae bacterium]
MRRIARIELLWALLVLTLPAVWGEDQGAVARGRLLYAIGGCTNCHTAEEGEELAGGDPLPTPFGVFYPPNITPDPDYGIGAWSDTDFIRAMQEGISPHGHPYYPAFPYPSYTRMRESDLKDLKAFLDTIPAVKRPSRPHELRFPFNIRSGLWLWRWLYFRPARFRPDPFRSQRWNRGAYLVEGPGHCGECHTPRNFLGGPDRTRAYAGSVLGEIRAPNITPDPEFGIGEWSDGDLLYFFQTGIRPDGDSVSGAMAKVIRNGTAKLPETDLRAIIEYLRSLKPVAWEPF